ncbi:MAG: hypothetical protein K9N09_09955 [Candidatus Cloacimonetes bacterium]|nr:hypothetical protein [Candidatus Cloacimonadota bacterium]MCF7814423.1 hypothetical protein [Candidatus Cloacimonadota bacterium]MCF7869015.1 hypothetical protein [Candidatus Cloacimonadota bacterium]MCF7884407.1 hypothetical protein [Candidatus Cloacimonadota bacterium]
MREIGISILFSVMIFMLSSCDLPFSQFETETYTITDFTPERNAENVSVFPQIIVNDHFAREVHQSLYFGTESPPPEIYFHSLENYSSTQNPIQLKFLENNTLYYWRVRNTYYQTGVYCYYYDTYTAAFTTCSKDSIHPEISVISPQNGQTYSGNIQIFATFKDIDKIGYNQCIFAEQDTLYEIAKSETIDFEWNTVVSEWGTKTLTFQSWDNTGAFNESKIEINILPQINIYNLTYFPIEFCIFELFELQIDNFETKTISFKDFPSSISYTWTTKGNSLNNQLFGEIITVDGIINYSEIGSLLTIRIPSNYGTVSIHNYSENHQFFILEGLVYSHGHLQTVFRTEFNIDIGIDRSYTLGYYDLTELNYFAMSICADSSYIPLETQQLHINSASNPTNYYFFEFD